MSIYLTDVIVIIAHYSRIDDINRLVAAYPQFTRQLRQIETMGQLFLRDFAEIMYDHYHRLNFIPKSHLKSQKRFCVLTKLVPLSTFLKTHIKKNGTIITSHMESDIENTLNKLSSFINYPSNHISHENVHADYLFNCLASGYILNNIDDIMTMDQHATDVYNPFPSDSDADDDSDNDSSVEIFKFDQNKNDFKDTKDINLVGKQVDRIVEMIIQLLKETGFVESYLKSINLIGVLKDSALNRVIETSKHIIFECIETLCNPLIHPPWRCYIITKESTLLFWYIPFNVDQTIVIAWR